MMVEPCKIPVAVQRPDGLPIIEWRVLNDLDQGREALQGASHETSVRRFPRIWTPVDDLHAYADSLPENPPVGVIWHASRCGSTLVSRWVGAQPNTVVYLEPEFLLQLQTLPCGLIDFSRTMNDTVKIYTHVASMLGLTCYLKPNSAHLLALDALNSPWKPSRTLAFIYRHPVEIIISLLQKPPTSVRQFQQPHFQPENLAWPLPANWKNVSPAQMLAMFLEKCFRQALKLSQAQSDSSKAPAMQWISYQDIVSFGPKGILPRLGISDELVNQKACENISAFHAHFPGQARFDKDDSQAKQDACTDEIRHAVEQYCLEPYLEMERARERQRRGFASIQN